jgi:glycosyltransferase involved in cell wall biosynthesis
MIPAQEPAGTVSDPSPQSASVVMPTYNRRGSIEPVIRATLADPATKELIVIVDGSTDGTYEFLCELAADEPRLRPIWQQNAAASRARHTGVELAGEAIVILLDDDVRAEPGLVAGHVSQHRTAERQVVLGHMPVTTSERWPDWLTGAVYAAAYERRCLRYESDPRTVLTLWAGNISRAEPTRSRWDSQAPT